MEKAISSAMADCIVTPLSSHRIDRLPTLSTSSTVVIHGPRGIDWSILFPLSHWPPCARCRARCDTSLATQKPKTWPQASASLMERPCPDYDDDLGLVVPLLGAMNAPCAELFRGGVHISTNVVTARLRGAPAVSPWPGECAGGSGDQWLTGPGRGENATYGQPRETTANAGVPRCRSARMQGGHPLGCLTPRGRRSR